MKNYVIKDIDYADLVNQEKMKLSQFKNQCKLEKRYRIKRKEKVMDKRREIRYSIIEYLDNTISKEDCILEIEVNGKIIAKSIDISMSGIGFEIIDVEQEQIETIQNNDNFFIKIYFAKEVVIIDAKKVWSAVMKENDKDVLKGGLSFSVISTEDRLKLLKYIEDIREKL